MRQPDRVLVAAVLVVVGLFVLGRLEQRRRGIVTIEDL
jgi:hypothetical protein